MVLLSLSARSKLPTVTCESERRALLLYFVFLKRDLLQCQKRPTTLLRLPTLGPTLGSTLDISIALCLALLIHSFEELDVLMVTLIIFSEIVLDFVTVLTGPCRYP